MPLVLTRQGSLGWELRALYFRVVVVVVVVVVVCCPLRPGGLLFEAILMVIPS